MYGPFLSILEGRGRKSIKKIEFDYYEKFLYITFYFKSHNTLYLIPYTITYDNIEKWKGDFRGLSDTILENLYSKYLDYDYPTGDNKYNLI